MPTYTIEGRPLNVHDLGLPSPEAELLHSILITHGVGKQVTITFGGLGDNKVKGHKVLKS